MARILRAGSWLVAIAGAAVLWASFVPVPGDARRLDAVTPVGQLVAIRPLLCVVAMLTALLVLVVARRHAWSRLPAVLLLVAGVAAAIQVAPRALSTADGADGRPTITVLETNTLRSHVAPAVIVGLVRRTRADVVTMPETNVFLARRTARALTAARGERWRAETDRGARSPAEASARPTSLVVREALGPVRLREPVAAPGAHGQVWVRLTRTRAARGLRVAAVHPRAPWPANTQGEWRDDLRALEPRCRESGIVSGDLNATIDHSPLRQVLDAGCDDAAATTGEGLRATWSGLGFVRPAIDHVLVSGPWRAVASGVLPLPGSDHRALWARIVRDDR